VWGYAVLRCPACRIQVGPDFVFCHACGATLRAGYANAPHLVYPPRYPGAATALPPAKVLWGVRTKRGASITMVALILLWVPGLSLVGAFLLSIGSTLIFWDRRGFARPHRSAVNLSYALFWVAAAIYAVVFLAFVSAAYGAWLDIRRMDALEPATTLFVWDSTVPTELIVVAVVLQVRFLLPPAIRRQAWWAGTALGGLVIAATVLAWLDVAAGLGQDFVRMSSVVGVLNRISAARLVEAPGFAWLAYLYFRARASIVPTAGPPDPAASVA